MQSLKINGKLFWKDQLIFDFRNFQVDIDNLKYIIEGTYTPILTLPLCETTFTGIAKVVFNEVLYDQEIVLVTEQRKISFMANISKSCKGKLMMNITSDIKILE